MHKAAVTGRMASMRLLLEYKADPGCSSPDGLTALHLAAWKGQTEAVRLLTSQAGANAQPLSNDGSTPLHEAVRSGESACVELLLQAGADASLVDRVCTLVPVATRLLVGLLCCPELLYASMPT